MTQQFCNFSLLPPEIRQRIWYFCLPRRTIESDLLSLWIYDEDTDFYLAHNLPTDLQNICDCGVELSFNRNRWQPLIARVCHESYQVVHRYGHVDTTGVYPTWRQPALDKLLFLHHQINRRVWYGSYYIEYEHDRSEVAKLSSAFAWARRTNMSLCVYHFSLYPYGFDGRTELEFWQEEVVSPQVAWLVEFATSGRKMQIPCAIRTLTLHVRQDTAALSGLFGRLGEEVGQLVDVYDTQRIQQYYEFWRTQSINKRRVARTTKLKWEDLLDPAELRVRVNRWLGQVQYVLLGALWMTRKSDSQDVAVGMENVFSPRVERGFPKFNKHRINEAHPWVVETLPLLPIVLPQVNIRYCSNRSCILRFWVPVRRFTKEILPAKELLKKKPIWRWRGRGRWRWRSWAKGVWRQRRCNAPGLPNRKKIFESLKQKPWKSPVEVEDDYLE